MRSNYELLGKYIRKVNVRNEGSQITNLKGINIDKEFMPSVANTIGSNMAKYKVVSRWQFAYNPMHVGRDEVLPICLLTEDEKIIVSPAYTVFEVNDKSKLDPEYLMMWCRRPEFDRNAWFTTDNSVRGGFSWESFCEMQLPVPSIEKQREIVAEYNTVVNRIQLNEQINQKLEETAKTIYRQWFEEFEFPISKEYADSIGKPELEGEPYKSSGGEMVYNEELDEEIPKGWEVSNLKNYLTLNYGKSLPSYKRIAGEIPVYSSAGKTGVHKSSLIKEDCIIIGRKGSIGTLYYVSEPSFCIDTAYFIKESDSFFPLYYSFMLLKHLNLPNLNEDSAVPGLSRDTVYSLKVINPSNESLQMFSSLMKTLVKYIERNITESKNIEGLEALLLSKMTKIKAYKKEVVK